MFRVGLGVGAALATVLPIIETDALPAQTGPAAITAATVDALAAVIGDCPALRVGAGRLPLLGLAGRHALTAGADTAAGVATRAVGPVLVRTPAGIATDRLLAGVGRRRTGVGS